MPKFSLNISILNHSEVFKANAGIFGKIPSFIFGQERIERLIEKKVSEELQKQMPDILQDELKQHGIRCKVHLIEEETS